MKINAERLKLSVLVLVGAMALAPVQGLSQTTYSQRESYARAKQEQHSHDAKHHTKAKIVGGSTAGGALVGGLLGGGKGALLGAGAGAGGGLIANHYHTKHSVRSRQRGEYGR